jgi:hypothetical protein
MFLAACAATISSCPPVKAYAPAFQERAAAELSQLPADSALGEMIADYGQLRDRVRLCR